jgi:hypothetical protein
MRILRLFGLDLIMTNRAWYLENDYFGGTKSKALRRVYDKNIISMRQDIGPLSKLLNYHTDNNKIKV